MEFQRERELVHLRYELRRLLADGQREAAAPLLRRLREIAVEEAGAAIGLHPEIERWASSFGL